MLFGSEGLAAAPERPIAADGAAEQLVGQMVRQLSDSLAHEEQLRRLMADAYRQLPVPNHLDSIPGIGPATAAVLTATVVDIGLFATPHHLVGYFGIFLRIILPLSKPALAAVAVFSFVYHWNDFFYPLIYINSASKYPVPYAIAQFANGAYGLADWNHLMALGLISALPCLALFFVAQRFFIQGIVVSGVKG